MTATRWVLGGLVLGALVAAVTQAPAAWLARALQAGSGERLLLADARGTVWAGSATPVLTGGPGSRDASALPGRLHWQIRPEGLAWRVSAQHACCLNGSLELRIRPGLSGTRVELLPGPEAGPAGGPARAGAGPDGRTIGQWPAAWLMGLGTPWNTLRPSGSLQLASPGLVLESAGAHWQLRGRFDLELNAFASSISTLDVLGSYRLTVAGDAAGSAPASVTLVTTSGALQLSGSGQLGSGTRQLLRFRGVASAAPGSEAVLNNVLNIIGRRQGAQAVISIG